LELLQNVKTVAADGFDQKFENISLLGERCEEAMYAVKRESLKMRSTHLIDSNKL